MKVQNPNASSDGKLWLSSWPHKETPKEISEAGPDVLMRVHLDKMNEGENKCYWRWKAPSYRLERYRREEKNDNKQTPRNLFLSVLHPYPLSCEAFGSDSSAPTLP